jgi:hypothetical protein
MYVPSSVGIKNIVGIPTKGTADRNIIQHINELKDSADKENDSQSQKHLEVMRQLVSIGENNENKAIIQALGVSANEKNKREVEYKNRKRRFDVIYEGKRDVEKERKERFRKNDPTIVTLKDIDDTYIKNCTAFKSKMALLSFTTIVCNGDLELMTTTSSRMTWFEEWFLYYEMVWKRSVRHWIGLEMKYKKGDHTLRHVFKNKLALILKCRASWPKYCTLSEDRELRKERWNERYPNERLVFWDNTNIKINKPSSPDAQ